MRAIQSVRYSRLFDLAIAIRVGQALLESVAGLLIKSTSSDETGGEFELSFMTAAGFGSAFCARHRS